MSSAVSVDSSSPSVIGQVLAIYVTKKRGEPMMRLKEVHAEAGKGLEGDRYYDGAGTFSAKISPAHEISLLESEALEALKRDQGVELPPILSRRNILTRGVALNHFVNREFKVGDVLLRGVELCEPCGHMEKLSGLKGARNGLVHRGGLRCQILKSGPIRSGDPISAPIAETAPPPNVDSFRGTIAAGDSSPHSHREPAETILPEVATIEAMQFSLVPPGKFYLGSDSDPLAWDGESPQQCPDLAYAYWIARFPVSHAQYREFIDARGYEQPEFWPEAISAGVWKDGLLESKVGEIPQREAPQVGDPFNRPAHPVGAVTWYEALAFARWLNRRWHDAKLLGPEWAVRLPSELEWEKAARGGLEFPAPPPVRRAATLTPDLSYRMETNPLPKRRFPWGDEPEKTRANSIESGVGATSPLGRYPGGASPYGVEELSGNVWEWTRSLFQPYPYPSAHADREVRETPSPNVLRTLKGGAFNYRESLVRCAARHCHSPMMRYRHIGFRVVISVAPPVGP